MPRGIYLHKTQSGFQKGHPSFLKKETYEKMKIRMKGKKYALGYKHTKKAKKAIGEFHKGKKWSLGYRHTMEAKLKIGETVKGEKNNFWKGGKMADYPELERVRKSREYHLWREAVYQRDNWTCQKCKDNRGGNLIAHHIQNFAQIKELRTSIENGITFCRNCHREFHKKYGNRNNTKEQLEEFFQSNPK